MISTRARKPLWTRARNQCAFPGCIQSLIVDTEATGSGANGIAVVGEEAHIRARSVGGPRYDANYEAVDEYENLVLMCPTHHTMIDANNGAGYSVEALLKMKVEHERNQDRREGLQTTLRAYLGDRYTAENTVQFQQVDLRGPSVDAMFVDVPVGCRRDTSALARLLERITESAPGDTGELERSSGLVISGATQALLHPEWTGNAVLVGGPGQGKSTVLQYVCQFHRARRLGESGYAADQSDLTRAASIARFPVRIDLRKYAQWAVFSSSAAKKGKKSKSAPSEAEDWRSIEEYLIEEVSRHIGANEFAPRDLTLLLATEPVLLALDGLDEVASLTARARVVDEIARMRGRLRADAADLVILVATRPGTSLQPLTSSGAFPVLHLQRLTQGLRLQYLDQWCQVAELSPEAAAKLQSTFMDSQHVPHINELASYPMQLAILLHLLHRRQLLPQQRTELYEEYLKTFLDREQTEDKEPLLASKRRVIEDTHAYLGWYLQTKAEEGQSAGSIGRDELRKLLRTYLAGRPKEQELAEELYSAITDRVLCLVERNNAFEFEVQSLREYFAALHVFDNLTPKGNGNSRDDGLNALLERPYWANVCRFFIGKLARGEVRGLISNFRAVEKKIAPHPLVRAMAATVLTDRIYDGLTNTEIRDVVDFILDGPGVILGTDGQLDPAGNSLRLSEEAGRTQVVAHLKARLEEHATNPTLTNIDVARSLSSHATPEDAITAWWWERVNPSFAWLNVAAHLRAFNNLSPEQAALLSTILKEDTNSQAWTSDLLLMGAYNGTDEALAQVIVHSLNDGSAYATHAHIEATEIGDLAYSAADVLAGPSTKVHRISPKRIPTGRSQTTARINQASQILRRDHSEVSSPEDWEQYLSVVADAWGDGWVLRRAMAMTPTTIDLSSIAARTSSAVLAAATPAEVGYRDHKSDVVWWKDHFSSITKQYEIMLSVLAVFEHAKTPVIIDLAPVLNAVVRELDPKRFRAVERTLRRNATVGRVRRLDLKEALRLRQVSLSGRVLWLVWNIATDSTRERITVHLEPELQDVFLAGAADGRAAVGAAQTTRKLKLDNFKGARDALPVGGWADQNRLASMTTKMAETVLNDPDSWPADLVQVAVDKLGTRAATRTSPLADIAASNGWFRT